MFIPIIIRLDQIAINLVYSKCHINLFTNTFEMKYVQLKSPLNIILLRIQQKLIMNSFTKKIFDNRMFFS
jgi:hypothetical protein